MSFEVKSLRTVQNTEEAPTCLQDDPGERLHDTPREYQTEVIIQCYSQDTTKGTSTEEKLAWWRLS